MMREQASPGDQVFIVRKGSFNVRAAGWTLVTLTDENIERIFEQNHVDRPTRSALADRTRRIAHQRAMARLVLGL